MIASVHGQVPVKSKDAMLAAITFRDLGLPGRDPVYGRGLLQAPQQCSPAATQDIAQTHREPAFAMPPSGVGATGASFGFAAGKP